MSSYTICTDTACDIKPKMLKDWGVECVSLSFTFEGEENRYADNGMDITTFYQRMRQGEIAKTSAPSPAVFEIDFERILNSGHDILHLSLSGALSATFNAAQIAAETLRQRYPERKIVLVDTLSASAGEGMMVYMAVKKKQEGLSIEDNAAYLESLKPHVCHRFIVDDLVYLKRGGRISHTVAFVGSVLGIKPILYVNSEGKPLNISKVRGKRAALSKLVEKYGELAINKSEGPIFISHADCLDGAENLKETLEATYGVKVDLITDIGTVLGAHAGPGTVVLFFLGSKR